MAGHVFTLQGEVQQYLEALTGEVAPGESRMARADPFLAYLLGVLQRAAGAAAQARALLLHAAAAWPLNWSAWVDLSACCTSKAEVDACLEALAPEGAAPGAGGGGGPPPRAPPVSPRAWVVALFQGHAYLEVQARAAALVALQPLSALFPGAPQLLSLVARALYGLHRFDAAQSLLTGLRERAPHRVEDADTLSNILFVRGDRAALATLAEEVWALDKYRPETCIAVGNFFSLRGEHDRAVVAFRRALRVAPSYSTAWTLLGHEYVEMRNLPAAIEAYRRATEADAADYRAWYGLGQAYELLGLPLYSLYYYKRAAALRPRDPRMWNALASCYEALEKRADALACLERACAEGESGAGEGAGGMEDTLLKLARLQRDAGEGSSAAQSYARYVQVVGGAGAGSSGGGASAPSTAAAGDVAEALLFLANAARAEGRLGAVESYASRILALPPTVQEREARALLAELRSSAGEAAAGAAAAAAAAAAGAAFQQGGAEGEDADDMAVDLSN